jgi:hypothetical protein
MAPIQTQIAQAAHEINRAYCQAIGDNSQPTWEDAPEWQKESAMAGVKLHMMNPDAGPEASHESWMAQKIADGWAYGPEKRPDLKQHPCLVPFSELPKEQQAKDFIFRAVVHSLMSGFAINIRDTEQACNELRADILDIEKTIREMKRLPMAPVSGGSEAAGEMAANLMLAVRHLEDARMRLGKVIQAMNGGVSIFDKPKE